MDIHRQCLAYLLVYIRVYQNIVRILLVLLHQFELLQEQPGLLLYSRVNLHVKVLVQGRDVLRDIVDLLHAQWDVKESGLRHLCCLRGCEYLVCPLAQDVQLRR